jgi:signal transduction histidine kinase
MTRKRFDWLNVILWLTLGVALLVALNLLSDLNQPFGGYIAVRDSTGEKNWFADMVTPSWWSGVQNGLPLDSWLVSLNGKPYGLDQRDFWRAAQSPVLVNYNYNYQPDSIRLPIVRFDWAHLVDFRLPDFITFCGYWLLAWLLYRSDPTAQLNRAAVLGFCVVGSSRWLYQPALFQDDAFLTRFLLSIDYYLVVPFLGPAIAHFALFYPVPGPTHWQRPALIGFYSFGGVASALRFSAHQLVGQNISVEWGRTLNTWALNLFLLGLGAALLFWLIRLIVHGRRNFQMRRGRQQLWFLLIATICTLPTVGAGTASILRGGIRPGFFSDFFFDMRYLMLGLPLLLAFVVLRYKTLQTASPLFITVMVLGTSGFLTYLVGLLYTWLVHRGPPADVVFFGAFINGLLWQYQASWRGVFGRYVEWAEHSHIVMRNFGEQILRDPQQAMPARIVNALQTEWQVERTALWLWDQTQAQYQLAAYVGHWSAPPPATLKLNLPFGSEILLPSSSSTTAQWPALLFAARTLVALAPLQAADEPVALLGLGPRWDEELFDSRDLENLRLVGQQAALFLLAEKQTYELRQVPRRLAEAQEHERLNIARELHDTVQQFLGRLPFLLEMSRQYTRHTPDEAEALLRHVIVDIKSAAQTVRQISQNLVPHQLENSIATPLRALIERYRAQYVSLLSISLTAPPELDAQLRRLDARHVLYRVIQQALDNIVTHAQAQHITITLEIQAQRVCFAVQDDGRGFGEAERQRAQERGSLGLATMSDRVTNLGGELQIESVAGVGTTVRGWLPTG